MVWALALLGCTPVCGTADFAIRGTGQELFDVDGDGTADLTERCGTLYGTFGLRRADLGLTQVLLSADTDASGALDFEITTYVLPASDLWLRTEHLVVGTVLGMESLNGAGLHVPEGEPSALYEVFPLIDATLEVTGQRKVGGTTAKVLADDDPEEWRLRWEVTYGYSAAEVAQTWVGEDWVQVADTVEIGEVLFPPPDWSPP